MSATPKVSGDLGKRRVEPAPELTVFTLEMKAGSGLRITQSFGKMQRLQLVDKAPNSKTLLADVIATSNKVLKVN